MHNDYVQQLMNSHSNAYKTLLGEKAKLEQDIIIQGK